MLLPSESGKFIDTDKLPDVESQILEMFDTSELLKKIKQLNLNYFFWICVPPRNGIFATGVKGKDGFSALLTAINTMVLEGTKNKYKLAIVPIETELNNI